MKRLIFILSCTVLLGGCASSTINLADTTKNDEAKRHSVEPGKSSVYVVFTGGWSSSWGHFPVLVDGVMNGILSEKTFVRVPLTPGKHTVSSFSEENQQTLKIEAKEGINSYVEIVSTIGWKHLRVSLKEISDDEGRNAVSTAELIEN